MSKPKVAAVGVPPLVMSGQMPCQYAYPGFLDHAEEHCETHGARMRRFADNTVVCLHCVEAQISELREQPHSYHDCFFSALHDTEHYKWRQLLGAALQAARCSGVTADISMTRFVVTAARRLELETAVVAGRVMAGDIAILLPPLTGALQG